MRQQADTQSSHRKMRKGSSVALMLHKMETMQLCNEQTSGVGVHRACDTNVLRAVVLMVKIKGAQGLANTDEFSLSDCYLDCMVARKEGHAIVHRCTEIIEDKLDPQWNQLFCLELDHSHLRSGDFTLDLAVYEYDQGSMDEKIGSVSVDLFNSVDMVKGAELGNDMSWVEGYQKEYEMEGEPQSEGMFLDSRLTASVVATSKLDFLGWCSRVGLNANSCIQHGVATAQKSLSHRAQCAGFERGIVAEKRREAEQLKRFRKPRVVRQSSMANLFQEHGPATCTQGDRAQMVSRQGPPQAVMRFEENRSRLEAFFQAYDARKVGNAEKILRMYSRATITQRLRRKYGAAAPILVSAPGEQDPQLTNWPSQDAFKRRQFQKARKERKSAPRPRGATHLSSSSSAPAARRKGRPMSGGPPIRSGGGHSMSGHSRNAGSRSVRHGKMSWPIAAVRPSLDEATAAMERIRASARIIPQA
jgi:hypothetical protein